MYRDRLRLHCLDSRTRLPESRTPGTSNAMANGGLMAPIRVKIHRHGRLDVADERLILGER